MKKSLILLLALFGLNSYGADDFPFTDLPALSDIDIVTPGNISFNELGDAVAQGMTTGILTGGIITINADPAKIDIAAGTGCIVDAYTTPGTTVITNISWSAQTAVVITNLATESFTDFKFNTSGVLVQQNTTLDTDDYRDFVAIGRAAHEDNIAVANVITEPWIAWDHTSQLREYLEIVGPFNISGNVYSDSGTNLAVDRSAGEGWRLGIAYDTSAKHPNRDTQASATDISMFRVWDDNTGLAFTTDVVAVVDPDVYDDGDGILGTVGNNQWSIRYFYLFYGSDVTLMRIGAATYSTEAGAIANAITDLPFVTDDVNTNGVLRTYLVVKKGASALDGVNASFHEVVNITSGGSGSADVTAATSFATDNALIRSDGTGKGVQDSGISIDDSDNVSAVNDLTLTGLVANSLETGITAGSTQTQAGATNLTEQVSNVTVVGTDLDGVEFPPSVAGQFFIAYNNDITGDNIMYVYPASGDDLGEGANLPISVDAGQFIVVRCIDATNMVAVVSQPSNGVSFHTGNGTLTRAQMSNGHTNYVTTAAELESHAGGILDDTDFNIITIGAIAVSFDPIATDLLYLDGTALDDGDKVTNLSTAGDITVIKFYDATGGYAATNSWTDGGA